ncbi:MAG: S8 family peptidase [Pseudoflavonifractor sp.]|nr:S8 family peptidase [Pseudoflavonifractor sp.]
MKKIYVSIAALAMSLSALSDNVFDLRTATLVDGMSCENRSAAAMRGVRSHASASDSVTVIATIDGEGALAALDRIGVVRSRQGDMCIVTLPADSLYRLGETGGIVRVAGSRRLAKRLDRARELSTVDAVHDGIDLPQGYDGSGVVVGLMDSGLYPSHIAFYDKDGSTSRVKEIHVYNENGVATSYTNPGTIAKFTTDDREETHGTHVAGIMTGAYSANGYQGVAPGADIVMTSSSFDDTSLLLGVEKIIKYAEKVGKPAVVNLSLGDNIGPHDGTNEFSRYLAELGKRGIICIAAGNEGEYKIVLNKRFTASDKSVKTLIVQMDGYGSYGNFIEGSVEMWSDDSSVFTVSVDLYDASGNKLTNLLSSTGSSLGTVTTVTSTRSAKGYNATFAKYYSGSVKISSEVNPDNDRYNVYVEYDCNGTGTNTSASRPTAYVGFTITGNAGQMVRTYCDGYYTELSSEGKSGFTDGGFDGTINGSACGDNVIVVGSYTSRTSVPLTNGTTNYAGTVKDVSTFSSWGTLADGRELPHVCAPGEMIVSTISTPYYSREGYDIAKNGKVVSGGKTSYWGPMAGTSMATPFMAGTAALWLQANPELTCDDIISIIETTSIKDEYYQKDANKVRWGAGRLDAAAGIKEVLRKTGIENVAAARDLHMTVSPKGDNRYEIFVAGETGLKVAACDMRGIEAAAVSTAGDTADLDLSAMAPGIYVVSATGDHGVYTSKVVVK